MQAPSPCPLHCPLPCPPCTLCRNESVSIRASLVYHDTPLFRGLLSALERNYPRLALPSQPRPSPTVHNSHHSRAAKTSRESQEEDVPLVLSRKRCGEKPRVRNLHVNRGQASDASDRTGRQSEISGDIIQLRKRRRGVLHHLEELDKDVIKDHGSFLCESNSILGFGGAALSAVTCPEATLRVCEADPSVSLYPSRISSRSSRFKSPSALITLSDVTLEDSHSHAHKHACDGAEIFMADYLHPGTSGFTRQGSNLTGDLGVQYNCREPTPTDTDVTLSSHTRGEKFELGTACTEEMRCEWSTPDANDEVLDVEVPTNLNSLVVQNFS